MVVVTGLLVAGCGGDDDGPDPDDEGDAAPWPGEGVEAQAYELGDGLVVDLPAGWEVTPFAEPEGWEPPCSIRQAQVSDGETLIDLELNGPDCAGAGQDQIGNGYHGFYVSLDDVPEPLDVAEQDVTAGALTTFSQDYFECTNSCTDYQDHVGLLALDSPADPQRPTLVLLDAKGDRSMADLVTLADAIHPA